MSSGTGMFGQEWPVLLAASLLAALAVARAARLVAEDDWPPSQWLRDRWIAALNGTGWDALVLCTFCVSPYLAAADLAWAVLSDLHWAWWLVNAWAALSYTAAIITARDLPPGSRE
jgi:hypothetical protein